MKLPILLSIIFIFVDCKVFQIPMKSTGSMKKKLVMSGKWMEYRAAALNDVMNGFTSPLIDYYDDLYLANVSLGTPWQSFTIVPDTGSANLWVIGDNCPYFMCSSLNEQRKKSIFQRRKSSTFKTHRQRFELSYGTGWCVGTYGEDRLEVYNISHKIIKLSLWLSLSHRNISGNNEM
ncbi:hypothetical protein AB6A40_009600 [Gnathostoma spinigerum]|uniref:Peptidase A1 domain-containing protein n=1 Tax=Gnathostoma spinigerum TaxID=75299 RepID=A0ABD6EU81_9BILA